jgi:oligopeptide/dipeptide ABC transporter ATP-binding protein
VVESGDIEQVMCLPQHPYTQMLINSIPVPDPDVKWDAQVKLPEDSSRAANPDRGCKFASRCPYVMDLCRQKTPLPVRVGEDHEAACLLLSDQA